MAGPQYTTCGSPDETEDPPKALLYFLAGCAVVFGLVGLIFPVALWASAAAIVQALYTYCDWALNKKLICLYRAADHGVCSDGGNQVCAIGEVGSIEIVGEGKSNVETVDNDYCIDLILGPVDTEWHDQFAHSTDANNTKLEENGPQGDLISQQPAMPRWQDGGYRSTFAWFGIAGAVSSVAAALGVSSFVLARPYISWTELMGHDGNADAENAKWDEIGITWHNTDSRPVKYTVPVLHCEFEGSRIKDVLDAINVFSFGGSWCKKNWFFGALCTILRAVFSPLALANALRAWAAASGGSQGDALTDPAAGEVKPYDTVIMRGRWVYDRGHDGYNEMHAVRTLQKVPQDTVPRVSPTSTSADPAFVAFEKFRKEWCDRVCEVPPLAWPIDPGMPKLVPKVTLSDAQQQIFTAQQLPQNQWTVHPLIDGCAPRDGVIRGTIRWSDAQLQFNPGAELFTISAAGPPSPPPPGGLIGSPGPAVATGAVVGRPRKRGDNWTVAYAIQHSPFDVALTVLVSTNNDAWTIKDPAAAGIEVGLVSGSEPLTLDAGHAQASGIDFALILTSALR